MNARILIPVFFLLCLGVVHGQDLIVKENGDSLNCKIVYVESEFIHFTYKDEKNETRVSMLPVKQIKSHLKDFYSIPEGSQNPAVNDSVSKSLDKKINVPYQKMRIGFYGGLSFETAKVSSGLSQEITNYLEELRSGYHFGVDATYFTSSVVGFGLKYSLFGTSNELERATFYDSSSGQSRVGTLQDHITIQFIAPSFTTRISSANKKTHFIADVALGYLWYKDEAIVISPFTLTGNTLGLQLGIGADVSIAKDVFLGVGMSYLMGSLQQYEIDNGVQKKTITFEDGTAEGLNRLDLSIGIHWSK